MLVGGWTGSRDSAGLPDFNDQLYVINGRPWPQTERMTYTMGDSVRWRVINASPDVHPLHLHGFYSRVDARGDMARDTTYWPAERRMAVTERLLPGRRWRWPGPDRPGGWVFHCHLTFHVVSNPGLGSRAPGPRSGTARFGWSIRTTIPRTMSKRGMGGS